MLLFNYSTNIRKIIDIKKSRGNYFAKKWLFCTRYIKYMKTPIVKYNDKFLDNISWFMRVGGITLWPFVVLRERYNSSQYWRRVSERIINHESIHIKQQEEMLVIPFYLWYVLEWAIKIPIYKSPKKAYYNISFEREAYDNDDNLSYLSSRKHYAWIKRILK